MKRALLKYFGTLLLTLLVVLGLVQVSDMYFSYTTSDVQVSRTCEKMNSLTAICWCYSDYMRDCPWERSLTEAREEGWAD